MTFQKNINKSTKMSSITGRQKIKDPAMDSSNHNNFRRQFSWKYFEFNFYEVGETKHIFVQSLVSWINPAVILIYRLVVFLYLLTAMSLSIHQNEDPDTWLVFLTSCNYVIVLSYFFFGLILSSYALFCKVHYNRCHKRKRNSQEPALMLNVKVGSSTVDLIDNRFSVDSAVSSTEANNKRASGSGQESYGSLQHARLEDNRLPSVNSDVFLGATNEIPLMFQFYWLISAIAINICLLVVLVYWIVLFRLQGPATAYEWYLRTDRHLIVLLWVLVDYFITRVPIRFLHFVYSSIVFLLYSIFNIAYNEVTGEIIYPVMDFRNSPYQTVGIVVAGSLVGIPLLQLSLYWAVYRLREWILS